MAQPRLSRLNLWQKHSGAVLEIVRHALELLRNKNIQGSKEPQLNRELLLCFYEAMGARRRQGGFVPGGLPMMEARNQPSPATMGTSAEETIPDIQWGYQDDQIVDAIYFARFYHIECKRLGVPTLSTLYVKNGIQRFVDPAWSYGKDVADGAMVGYIEQREAPIILREVNTTSSSFGLPPLRLVSSTSFRFDLAHELDRAFAESPFRLHHLWLDISASSGDTTAIESTLVEEGAVPDAFLAEEERRRRGTDVG